ncbi:hypothetical protein PRZ48_005957 [Zasmidium cellare]|uniref:homoserine dehydrogenase n=1 Tax=Zasmidium cellare TaxID=395010 RepID=A0ABR0ELR8_ZASCE|nr:hypothetical protein PRZ48_005957 [Zasmidium cellare]
MRTVRVAILGQGAVGTRIAHLLLERKDTYHKLYATDIRLVAIFTSSKGLHRAHGISQDEIETPHILQDRPPGANWLENEVGTPDVLFDCGPSDFDRVPEPGSLPYYRLMLAAGKTIIAVSKSALASHGPELATLCKTNDGWIGMSGAAGAALPALDLLRGSVLGCTINKIEGCLNATTNYVLDALMQGSAGAEAGAIQTLADAVKVAQSQGFAERDASRDIEGMDSMAKLVLLANFGVLRILDSAGNQEGLRLDDVHRNGLSNNSVTSEAIAAWNEASMTPRLVSTLEQSRDGNTASGSSGKWTASVSLQTYPSSHPFSSLRGTMKGVLIHTEEMGEIFASACGPEPEATAASALKDFQAWLRDRSRLNNAKRS